MGISVYTCTICGETDTRTTPAIECDHDEEYLTLYYTQEATCTATGKKVYICSKCNKEITEILPMVDHVSDTAEGKGFITAGAVKCVSDGAEEVVCKNCGQTFTRPISAHNYKQVNEIPATCTEAKQLVYKCEDCGAEKTESDGEALGHSFNTTIEKAATCVDDGRSTKVCSVCSYTEKKVIPATGHKETSVEYYYVTIDKNGEIVKGTQITNYKSGMTSCTSAIAKYAVCGNDNCNLKNKEMVTIIAEKRAHSVDTTKSVVTGIFACDDNGNLIINHDSNGKVIALTDATVDCTHAKAQVFTCATCGTEQYTIITPKTEHTKIAGTEGRVAPTCTTDGYTTYSCSTCKKTIKDTVLPALGHDYVYVAETCTDDAKVECTRCKNELTYNGTKNADNTTYNLVCAAAYETGNTTIEYNAKAKGNKYTLSKATGHNFNGSNTKLVDGLTYKHCNTCGKDVVVSLEFEEEPVKATAPSDKLSTDPVVKAKEEKVNSRMEKVTITRDGNVVTIKQNKAFVDGDISGTNNNDCFGIMMDLGIEASKVEIVSSNPEGYKFNPDGTDTNTTEMKRWNDNATENSFMIWLCPNDFTNGKRDITITFKDKSENSTTPEPITITFKYVPLEAE